MLTLSVDEQKYLKRSEEITENKIDLKALEVIGLNQEEIDYLARMYKAYTYVVTPAGSCNDDLRYALWSLNYLPKMDSTTLKVLKKSYEDFRKWLDSAIASGTSLGNKNHHVLHDILKKVYDWTITFEKENGIKIAETQESPEDEEQEEQVVETKDDSINVPEPQTDLFVAEDSVNKKSNQKEQKNNGSEKDEGIEALLKELSEDMFKYDLRFWPDNKITLDAIKGIISRKVNVMFHRIDYVIRAIFKKGGTPEQMFSIMQSNYKQRIKMLIDVWWKQLNSLHKDALESAMHSRNADSIADSGKQSGKCYAEYKMFCEYISEKPNIEPEFITKARHVYLKLKEKGEGTNMVNNVKSNACSML